MIYEAVKTRHQEITVVGTVGPFASGEDYDNGWAFARDLKLPVVDEHRSHTRRNQSQRTQLVYSPHE